MKMKFSIHPNSPRSSVLFRCGTLLLCLLWEAFDSHGQSGPPVITTNPVSQIVFVGNSATFSVTAQGEAPLSYQWRKNNTLLTSRTNATLVLTGVTTNDSAAYAVVVANSQGLATSSVAVLNVLYARMWAMGENSSGQLGDATLLDQPSPVSPVGGVKVMAAGSSHTLFVKPDNSLWAVGNNGCGQLGDNSTTQRITPVPIASEVATVAACANQSFFIQMNGDLWAMGYNSSGQLGDGSTSQHNSPVKVAANVKAIAAGVNHSLFISSNGVLWAMGDNSNGQLGDGTATQQTKPVKIATNVIAAAAGAFHSLYIQSDGSLWGMGNNTCGQLGETTASQWNVPVKIAANVTQIACGAYHSAFVKSDGTLWTMGDNENGQLGDGTTTQLDTPINVSARVVSVSAGFFHTLFVDVDGTLWAMGANNYGQLGNGNFEQQTLPIRVNNKVKSVVAGGNHTLFAANRLQPFKLTQEPLSQSTWEGQDICFSAQIYQEPELSYEWQWRKDGIVIPGAQNPSLCLTNVQKANEGRYSASISISGVKTVVSTDAYLVVMPFGAPTVWADGHEVVGVATKAGPTTITLDSWLQDAYIFYTLDGSAPTYSSQIYDAPFVISTSVIIRAIGLSSDFSQSAEAPATTIIVLPYTVSASTKGGGAVALDPIQPYYSSQSQITITATPDSGWSFLRWEGNAVGTNNPLQLKVGSSMQIEAVFATELLTNVIGNGSIQIFPSGLAPYGTTVQLRAIPDPNNIFVVWGNDVSGWINPLSYKITSPTPTIGALFSTAPQGKTTITSNPYSASAGKGESLMLSVGASGTALSYQWRLNGTPIPGATNATFSISGLSIAAAGRYDVVVSGSGGTVTSSPASVSMTDFNLYPVVSVYGNVGMTFHIDYSDNLETNSWTLLKAGILADTREDVIDFSTTTRHKRFYRVVIDN